jgi:hypothetical protein
VITLDQSRYQTLTITRIEATLSIDEHGRVMDAKFEPAWPTALDFQLNQDAGSWLFLPAVVHGQPKAVKAVLPLQLTDFVPAAKRRS